MQVDNLNRWLTLSANVGVIAGIVFLAIEIQQNNDLLTAQARRDQLSARTANIEVLLNNPVIAQLELKGSSGQPLSPEEQLIFRNFAVYNFIHWDWQYQEYQAGLINDLPTRGWAAFTSQNPQWYEIWKTTYGRDNDSEFAQHMEENVFHQ
jgi:hypothetical protein